MNGDGGAAQAAFTRHDLLIGGYTQVKTAYHHYG